MAAEDNRGPQAAAVAILFLALSWTAVLLRCYVRTVMTKSFGIDDWLAVATLLLFTFYCTFVLDGVHYGTGRHITQISAENFIISMKAWWIAELGYVSCTTILKLSIGFFLLRVCVRKYQRIIIWVVMAVVLAFSSYYFLLVILQCHPTSYFWLQYVNPEGGSCVDPAVISGSTYAHSAISAWADWTLGILPIFLVWDLKMNPRTKVSVALILALGALGSTATIVRIPFVHQLTETQDFLYANVDVSIWSTVEPGIGITASAMATMRPLFINFFSRSKLLGSSTRDGLYANSKPRARSGYLRSNGDVELGVNTNTGTKSSGITVTTVIESEQKDDTGGMSSEAAWPLPSDEDDARDRIRKLQVLGNGSWELRGGGNASGNVGGGAGGGVVLNKTWNSSESRLTNSSYS